MDFNAFINDVVGVARQDMTEAGYEEIRSPEEADEKLAREGTTLVMINTVCGCAGGVSQTAAAHCIHYDKRPDHLVTVFAGHDREATDQARSYFGEDPAISQ